MKWGTVSHFNHFVRNDPKLQNYDTDLARSLQLALLSSLLMETIIWKPSIRKRERKTHTHRWQTNFYALRSSPPLWNICISCYTSIWSSLVSHPVDGRKFFRITVISSCSRCTNLQERKNNF